MARLGADVDQLDALASKFRNVSGQIQNLRSQLSSQVEAAWWEGADAQRFKSDWHSTYSGQLRNLEQTLNDTAQRVANQANQQRQTSGG